MNVTTAYSPNNPPPLWTLDERKRSSTEACNEALNFLATHQVWIEQNLIKAQEYCALLDKTHFTGEQIPQINWKAYRIVYDRNRDLFPLKGDKITIKFGGQEFPIPKHSLLMYSRNFQTMLSVNLESKDISIALEGERQRGLLELIKTGKIVLTDENVMEMLTLADEHEIDILKKPCADYLKDVIPNNVLHYLQLGCNYDNPELRWLCIVYLLNNKHLLDSVDFKNVSSEVKTILEQCRSFYFKINGRSEWWKEPQIKSPTKATFLTEFEFTGQNLINIVKIANKYEIQPVKNKCDESIEGLLKRQSTTYEYAGIIELMECGLHVPKFLWACLLELQKRKSFYYTSCFEIRDRGLHESLDRCSEKVRTIFCDMIFFENGFMLEKSVGHITIYKDDCFLLRELDEIFPLLLNLKLINPCAEECYDLDRNIAFIKQFKNLEGFGNTALLLNSRTEIESYLQKLGNIRLLSLNVANMNQKDLIYLEALHPHLIELRIQNSANFETFDLPFKNLKRLTLDLCSYPKNLEELRHSGVFINDRVVPISHEASQIIRGLSSDLYQRCYSCPYAQCHYDPRGLDPITENLIEYILR